MRQLVHMRIGTGLSALSGGPKDSDDGHSLVTRVAESDVSGQEDDPSLPLDKQPRVISLVQKQRKCAARGHIDDDGKDCWYDTFLIAGCTNCGFNTY